MLPRPSDVLLRYMSGVWTLAMVSGVALTAALLTTTLTHDWSPFCFFRVIVSRRCRCGSIGRSIE